MIRSRGLAATAFRQCFSSPSHSSLLAPLVTTRHSSLSAIHRGLRQSDRVQGTRSSPKSESRRPKDATIRHKRTVRENAPDHLDPLDAALRNGRREGRGTNARTAKALAGAASPRLRAKLRKKLAKQAAEEEEEDGKQSRRKRFINPEATHGKKSLVYQLKYGNLKEMAAKVKLDEPVRPVSFRSRVHERRDRDVQRTSSGNARREPFAERRSPRDADRPRRDELDRPRRHDRDNPRREESDRPRRGPAWDPNASDVDKARKGGFMPMTIKYTTAASQFLYGRSVVKAALSQARRKLFNLYIYGNDARIDKKDDDAIRRLAHSHKVPITVVPEGEQRLMDKMSSGRPHNGYVLETSPLPLLPVKSLGSVVEIPGKLGFNVALGHQTKEEVEVNGESNFIPRANNATPKPFVLLLNEILDPGNLGGLIRTASYLGVDAVGITSRSSSTLTPVVLKSAAGAVEEVTIFTVDDPVAFIESSRKEGWKTYAAVAPPAKILTDMHVGKFVSSEDIEHDDPLAKDPCVLMLGNEGHGLSKKVKIASDFEVSVPRFVHGASSVDSLNVSVAAGLLCHSFVKGSAAKARRPGVTGAVELEANDEVSKAIRENARELF
ncbi:hypothetical protein NLU13_7439 [Sarocladium strictum]|uniref:rRNA methyltransferase 1, mitochondrial n=1 Tax=Sarocladium strictum TaxID=5046 RepID=A0AA39L572_SARSR|nr:hypothetical protein NLU13_7439 [Sarocladium strictum]